jgi:uncharacterized membrane protein YphA (DoxX/SURF4 family)
MHDRARYSLATMAALVLVRLAIGWHFYSEGTSHVRDPVWSSEGFLRAAKGPLAEHYHALLPDFYGWRTALRESIKPDGAGPIPEPPDYQQFLQEFGKRYSLGKEQAEKSKNLLTWAANASHEFSRYLDDFRRHYALDDAQAAEAEAVLQRRQHQIMDWLGDNLKGIEDHLHEWRRVEAEERQPTAENLPFQKKRISDKLTSLKKESSAWIAKLNGIETAYRADLADLLKSEQAVRGAVVGYRSRLQSIDSVMKYGLTAVGVCLVLGLFTRLASLAGAAFLLSVALSQPFWLPDTTPTYNQIVEMFTLLALATTHVGRWGGLDFFIHYLVGLPRRRERL